MPEKLEIKAWHRRGALAGLAVLAAAAVGFGVLALSLAVLDPFGGAAHPSDAAMLAQFKQQRTVLERLAAMARKDGGLKRLGPEFMKPEDLALAGVTAERVALYRKLFVEAGVAEGMQHYGDAIQLIVDTRGLAIAGSAKSFTYRAGADPDAVIVDGDLDAAVDKLADKDVLLQRHIDGNWWLELDRR